MPTSGRQRIGLCIDVTAMNSATPGNSGSGLTPEISRRREATIGWIEQLDATKEKTMSAEMTRAEFYAKYGDVEVTFTSYYKYTFTYAGMLPDGKRLTVDYGGDSDEIYRHEVASGCAEKVSQLQPYAGRVYEGTAEVEGFYDY